MTEQSSDATIRFTTAAAADRRIAGVSAAGRRVQALAATGGELRLMIGDSAVLSPATLDDIERLRGTARVTYGRGEVAASDSLPSGWEVVRATGKPGDGLVSRWLNRPLSQRISWLLLHVPGIRPHHVTVVNALVALAIITVLPFGGHAGLIAGGILFHFASMFDGVDGEMARATFRTSPAGATLDSVVDMATNLLFLIGLTINLWLRDGPEMGWIGVWSMALMIAGAILIGRRTRAGGAPLGFDMFKRSGRIEGPIDLIYWIVQTLSSRDCFAFLFMALILTGLERVALYIFASVATIWFPYVLLMLVPRLGARRAPKDNAA